MPKEIADLLQAEGWDVKPQLVSTIKTNMKAKKDKIAAPKAAPKKVPATSEAADAVSFDALKKAKELAAQLGGVNNAKETLEALAELLD